MGIKPLSAVVVAVVVVVVSVVWLSGRVLFVGLLAADFGVPSFCRYVVVSRSVCIKTDLAAAVASVPVAPGFCLQFGAIIQSV